MLKRHASATLRDKAKHYPVVAITGPRQSGKSTLAKMLFPTKPYLSLEDLDHRQFALQDPRGFLAQFPKGAVLDEVQHCPDLFSYLQTLVDAKPKPGLFILTGSQQFGLLAKISQSLAGRVGFVQLLPFTLSELQDASLAPSNLEKLLFTGLYPPIYARKIPPNTWHSDYIMTYIERDVRQLVNVQDLRTFRRFLQMCAARTGQILNLSSLANDCGITHNTAKSWISVLEASYILFLLPPHYRNFSKRLIKSPKLYFYDTGLVCTLLGLQNSEQLVMHSLRGALFETWVVSELIKNRFNNGLISNLYFWRDSQGHEVDVIIEQGDDLIPIEIKAGQTISSDYFSGLDYWRNLSEQAVRGKLVYAGKEIQKRNQIDVIGWQKVDVIEV
ncbi:MAG: AAA family ATPase [Gammaproteobacteria bacterium RIFCSPHIGHO2_12_FULL_40_19]|nr:MAG: AAA family ATPase [Gammaproteobacteria bacterium RIFCSPHIGHO2_12_FULL_40_19]